LPADWSADLTGDGRLTIIPMPVMVGEEIYGEGEDDISETIALALASGTSVKTSRPSPGQFEQAYLAAQRRGGARWPPGVKQAAGGFRRPGPA
jgi:fatty acid-binding protein DegV